MTTAEVLRATTKPAWTTAFPDINAQVFPRLPPETPPETARTLDPDDDLLERKLAALEAHSRTAGMIGVFGRGRYAAWFRLEAFQQRQVGHVPTTG